MRLISLAAAGLCLAASACAPEAEVVSGSGPDAAYLGDADAPVTIIEYASTTCGHCASFHTTVFPHVREAWIETGRARLVMRVLPTAPAELSVAGSLLARCAGPDRYFAVLSDLFRTQPELFAVAQTGGSTEYYEAIGAAHGVSPDELSACLADEAGIAQINASIDEARAAGVAGTPAFFINGAEHGYMGDLETPEAWDAAMQAALDAAAQ